MGTPNALSVIGSITWSGTVLRSVENLTSRGVTLIDCWRERGGVPLHWFAETSTKPPLDIQIMAHDGSFQRFKFVLQDEAVPTQPLYDAREGHLDVRHGIPLFDLSPWRPGRTHVFVDSSLACSWTAEDELCIAVSSVPIGVARQCVVSDSLVFLLDDRDTVTGLLLRHFTATEKAAIGRAAPI